MFKLDDLELISLYINLSDRTLTLCRGTAGILLVLPRYCLGTGARDPVPCPTEPAGLVGLGPPGLVPGLRWDDVEAAPGLTAGGVKFGLLGDGERCPQGPASACKNLNFPPSQVRIDSLFVFHPNVIHYRIKCTPYQNILNKKEE